MKRATVVFLLLIQAATTLAQLSDQPAALAAEREELREELRKRTRSFVEQQIKPLRLKDLLPTANSLLTLEKVKPDSIEKSKIGSSASGVVVPLSLLRDGILVQKLLERDAKIYRNVGNDDRIEVKQALDSTNQALKRLTREYRDSVAALFLREDIRDNGDGTSTILKTETLSQREGLCKGSRFGDQPAVAFATGFLIRSNLLATAGHCLYELDAPPIERIRAVFGWECDSKNQAPTILPNSNIFVVTLVSAEFKGNGDNPDWAILALDRNANRSAFKIRTAGRVVDNTKLVSFGYPSGIPLKIAGAASVNLNTNVYTFTSSLDVYAGNSGSPVVNMDGIVEGIVASGGIDYVLDREKNCRIPLTVPDTGLRGFYCTRITFLAAQLP